MEDRETSNLSRPGRSYHRINKYLNSNKQPLFWWQVCKENFFCPGGAVNISNVCPNGTYSLSGSDDVGDCRCPLNSVSIQNSRRISECICEDGYYKVFNPSSKLGGWFCQICLPGQFCYNNTNKTCPAHSTSFADAGNVLDCYCYPGYANATIRTEAEICRECPANHYCTGKGSISMCVANAVSPSQSQSSDRCYCDWGWKGVNNSVCVECTSPTYCYGGIQAQCPSGSFSFPRAWNQSNCSCVPGYWGPVGERAISISEPALEHMLNWCKLFMVCLNF